MNNEVFRDKRLLGALDYIDERFIAEVTESYTFEAPGEYKRDKKTVFRAYRRLAVLAACLVLISAVIPIVNYVLPRFGITLGGNAGAGTTNALTYTKGDFTYLKPIGEVPEKFKKIVDNNLFAGAEYTNGMLYTVSWDDDYVYVNFYDKYGESISVVKLERGGEYYPAVHEIYPTSDGNYIIVFDSSERNVDGNWVVMPQKFVRFSLDGRILSEAVLRNDFVGDLGRFFETDSGYIFVGDCNTDKIGNRTTNDIALLKLDFDGNIVKYVQTGGNDFDTIHRTKQTPNGVKVYFYLHSKSDSKEVGGYKMYEYDNDLNLVSQKDIEEDDIPGLNPRFYISGNPYYNYEDFFADFDSNKSYGGKVIEYDDFVLFISTHYTFTDYKLLSFGDPYPEHLYHESVYSAYSYDGELLWRATVDTTDYEMVEKILDEREKYQNNPITLPEDYDDYAVILPLDPRVPIDTD
ncbi:MAG: hypothetical protein J6S71_10590 [Clostridia bacterium]|nr:hypothetical protein [Clostridia bacterium]